MKALLEIAAWKSSSSDELRLVSPFVFVSAMQLAFVVAGVSESVYCWSIFSMVADLTGAEGMARF